MFGLDARMALAIFGALSVISGAALYSAISQSKATATVAQLEELAKGYQAYLLDTGEHLVFDSNPAPMDIALKTLELIKSSKAGWAGPYISYSESDGSPSHPEHEYVDNKYLYIFYIKAVDDNTFGSYTGGASQTTCEGNTKKCAIWIGLNDVGSLAQAKAIDMMIDGSETANEGRLRVRSHSSTKYALYYKIMSVNND